MPVAAPPWLPQYADGTAYRVITGGGTGSFTDVSTVAALTGAANGARLNWTGSALASAITLVGKQNLTITNLKMANPASLTFNGGSNIRVQVSAPYELTGGGAIVFARGAFSNIEVFDSFFGPLSAASTPPATKSRFIMFGDSGSVGSQGCHVINCQFQNKNGPGNFLHFAGKTDDPAGKGGVSKLLVSGCGLYFSKPFDANDHESILAGLSNMQLTDGELVVEFCRFEGNASEPEVISSKMNNARIRGCTFVNNVGSVSLRHGDHSKIHDCHLYGDASAVDPDSGSLRVTAGARAYGLGHEIHHLTIRVRGDANYERPILLDTGDVAPGSTSNSHAYLQDVDVHHCLLVKCGAPIVVGDNYDKAPTGTIHDNKIVQCTNAGTTGILQINNTSLAGLTITNNQVFDTTTAAGLTQGTNGEWIDPTGTTGARVPFLTVNMVGPNSVYDPWAGTGVDTGGGGGGVGGGGGGGDDGGGDSGGGGGADGGDDGDSGDGGTGPISTGQPMAPLTQFLDGVLVDAAALNNLSYNLTALCQLATGKPPTAGVVARPALKVSQAASHSIPNAVAAGILSWDVEELDTDGMWDPTDPSIITIQTAGWYEVHLQGIFPGVNPASRRAVTIFVNGTTDPGCVAAAKDERMAAADSCRIQTHLYDRFAAGTVLRAGIYQESGSSIPSGSAADFGGQWMSVTWDAPF